ncbi:DEAD/DEAH box helicase [Oerskovia sp. Sa1BUA8]|uniref:RNA helicase n=1 Tax=Oerskovia douganii TaxID=2762210 RepID=A0A9D5YZC0_9CELL|nr:DEAD/DEAH box helicase [Oerskovia douganii]MBE7700792.1 DEAD/DEAH box helicase [Oerskovia douganii]
MTTTETPIEPTELDLSPAETSADLPADDAQGTLSSTIQAKDVSFADFGVRPEIVEALADAGITHPFPIQAMTLPVAMSGHDIIGQAKTGTGKTLGFGVPLLHRVVAPGEEGFDQLPAPGKPQALVIVPTRELAVQVAGDLEAASAKRSVRIIQLYGGRAYEPQIATLNAGVEVVVGTPGRMIDLMNQGHLNLTRARCVVLDEADEMLDLGFLPDVEKLLSRTPAARHTMLFSATMPGAVVSMARRYMTQPTHIRANDPDDGGQTVKNIKQVVYRAHALDKVEVLARILQSEGRGLTIVFARTKRTAAKVADELADRGFASGAIHGDLGQGAREQALRAFRSGKIDVLVATDVAARGIDVDDVTHVVNYQCPEDEKTYLHRTGRTGRAGNKGTAVTFVDWDDVPRWSLINKALDLDIPEPVETYSTSPHLYTDLNIPEGTKGRLPKSAQTRAGLDAEKLEDLGETGKRGGSPSSARGGRDAGRSGSRDAGRSGGRDSGRSGSRDAARSGGREGAQRSGATASTAEAQPGRTEAPAAGGPVEGAPSRPRRQRNRRRTHGGASGTGASGAPAPTE